MVEWQRRRRGKEGGGEEGERAQKVEGQKEGGGPHKGGA